MSGVQEHETRYLPRVARLEAPDIDSRIGMAHQHEWPLFARSLQPCVQIVDYLINRLQRDLSLVARAKTGMVIAAHSCETGHRRLYCRPILGGSSAGRNQNHRRRRPGFAVAVNGNATISDGN